jgi:transposase
MPLPATLDTHLCRSLLPVNNATDTLPDDIEELKRLVLEQRAELAQKCEEITVHRDLLDQRDREVERLNEQLALLRAKRFGRSSEKYGNVQGLLFDEAELETEIAALEAALAAAEQAKRERTASDAGKPRNAGAGQKPTHEKPKRKPLPDHLKRVEIVVDVSDEQRHAMGDDWVLIGHEISEQLACQERQYYIKQIKRCKYVRKSAAQKTSTGGALTPGAIPDTLLASSGIKVAAPLPVMLPKAIADASLLAKIIAGKYVDALSFNRERKVLEREGVSLSYTTICSYPIQVAERLEPLKALFYEYAASMPRWHLDETTLQVLQEPGRNASQKSYLWALRAGPPGAEIVLF